jgi:hypothetical protein
MNTSHTEGEQHKLKYKLLHIGVVFLLIGTILLLFMHIKKSVNEQLVLSDTKHETPSELLNHANTLYWLGRTYGNSIYEFQKSEKLALRAKELLKRNADSVSNVLRTKADKIIANARHNREQNALTVNNKYPYFLDFSGLNELPEEDQPLEELDRVTTIRVLTKLMDLPDPNSALSIREYPYFSILIHNSNDPQLHEAGIQYLNLTTKQYTISEHEIAQITGEKNYNVAQILKDTANITKICDFFNCSELAVISVNKQDQFDGIYYYGANIRLISARGDKLTTSRYTETFTAARGYNAMLGIKIPLLCIYLLLLILGVELLSLLKLFAYSRIKWHRFILVGFIALTIHILSIEALAYFWNPESGEFAETDKAMVWIFAVALSFTLIPLLIGHLTVGKLDRFISSFDSGLDDKNGLFSVVFPGLTVYSVSITYYNLLRFGISDKLYLGIYAFIYSLVISYLLSDYWKKMKELPSKSFLFHKISVYTLLGIIVLSAILFPYSTFGNLDYSSIHYSFVLFVCIPLLLSLINNQILKYYFKIHSSQELQKTIDFKDDHYIKNLEEDSMLNSLKKDGVLVLYGAQKMGKTWLAKKIAEKLAQDKLYDNLIFIDFSLSQSAEEKNKINYYPFAEAFSHLLPKNVFNDQAEEARKSGNILGKLISSITSAGDFLVDESESKPAELSKILEIILKKLEANPKTLIVFDNIHLTENENKELFLSFLNEIQRVRTARSTKVLKKQPLVLFTSTQGFHIKREFENLIEGLMNFRNTENKETFRLEGKLYSLSEEGNYAPFFNVNSDPQFLKKYLSSFKIGIFDKKSILEKFKRSEKDKTPGLITELLKTLHELQQIAIDKKTIRINKRDFEMPEIVEELEFYEAVINTLSPDLLDILRCCAYAALEDGEFEVEAISYILEKKRLDILHHLNSAENLNIVYDTKDKNDWYRFNDTRFIMVLKKQDSQGVNQLFSQLGKEYYQRWVNFYFDHFDALKKDVINHRQTLISLAERAFLLNEINPEKSLLILKEMGYFFLEPQISLLENAKKSFENALGVMSKKNSSIPQKEIYELQVKGLLRTLDEKNEINSAQASDILKISAKIVLVCPELSNELFYLERLAYEKSPSYQPDNARQFISEISTKLANEKLDSVYDLKLRFLMLLLEPKGGASFEKLKELCGAYEELIQTIQRGENSEVYLSGGVYQQILNNYGGSIIGDKMIGHPELMSDDETRLDYFLQSITILKHRVKIELDRFVKNTRNEHVAESIQEIISFIETKEVATLDDALELINKIVLILNYKPLTYFVDRKGLSYTVNYITRALYYYCTDNHEARMQTPELNLTLDAISTYAYELNHDVQDSMGIIMSASFKGLILQKFGSSRREQRTNEAFNCFEESFAQSFNSQHHQATLALSNMANLLKSHPNTTNTKLTEKLKTNQMLYAERHILTHFRLSDLEINGSLKQLKADNIVENDADLKKLTDTYGSKFDSTTFKNPKTVVDFIMDKVKNEPHSIAYENGKAYLQLQLNDVVGTNNVIALNELPNDVEITTGKRGNFNEAKLVSGIAFPITNFFSAILSKDLDYIETAHPGPISPQFPSTNQPEEIMKANSDYWTKHAFIINEK